MQKFYHFSLIFITVFIILPNSVYAQCESYDFCIETLSETTVFTNNDFDYSCIQGQLCSDFTPEINLPGDPCIFHEETTVWNAITIENTAKQLFISFSTEGNWSPVLAAYLGGCENLVQLEDSMNGFFPCSNMDASSDHLVLTIPEGAIQTDLAILYIACSTKDLVDIEEFELCINATEFDSPCIFQEENFNPTEENFTVVNRSFGGPVDGPFYAGEEIQVCFNYSYDATTLGNDWIKSITPTFGEGWDPAYFDGALNAPFGTEWFVEEGDCGPRMQEDIDQACIYADADGKLQICNLLYEVCPCEGGIQEGDFIPSSWFWNSSGASPSCVADTCSPSFSWGLPAGVMVDINFCFDLRVRETIDACNSPGNLQMSFHIASDELTGCWDEVIPCTAIFTSVSPSWETACGDPPALQYASSCAGVDLFLQEYVFCDLNDMDGLAGRMFDTIVGPRPNPLCNGFGSAHNMTWFAFIAPSGEFELTVNGDACTMGDAGFNGFQIGIYEDCSFLNAVFCDVMEPHMSVTMPSDILTPGELYYLFLDSWAHSVCDFQFDFNCLSGDCNPIVLPEPDVFIVNSCFNMDSTICLENTLELSIDGYENADVDFVWEIQNQEAAFQQIYVDLQNVLSYDFPEAGTYSICGTVSSLCYSYTICEEYTVIDALESITFPPLSICETGIVDVPDYTVGGETFTWDHTINVSGVGGETFSFMDTVETNCCFFEQSIEISILQDAVGTIRLPTCPLSFPVEYNGNSYTDYGSYSELLEGASLFGCDSILIVEVVSGNKNCSGVEDLEIGFVIGVDSLMDNSKKIQLRKNARLEEKELIRVFPNPASERIYLESDFVDHESGYDYSLIDLYGKIHATGSLKNELDISSYTNGVYLLRITHKSSQLGATHRISILR